MSETSEKEKLLKEINGQISLVNSDVRSISVTGMINENGITLQIKDRFSGNIDEMNFKSPENAFEFLYGIHYGANAIINSNLSDLIYRC
ncbi:hypothetical protein [Methanococcus maripaludis]|uniref:Uncharacterized protein n=1 Tax=Methanococcus maripaludis TaxID=39152 RepID=A0A8T3VYF4_METMI|nr:hypothetical protein [Methanococcus maripaludis]MBG0768324.1 hypothetical protein [Methanococcus maripaludis]